MLSPLHDRDATRASAADLIKSSELRRWVRIRLGIGQKASFLNSTNLLGDLCSMSW